MTDNPQELLRQWNAYLKDGERDISRYAAAIGLRREAARVISELAAYAQEMERRAYPPRTIQADEDTVEFSVDVPLDDRSTADDVTQAFADMAGLMRRHFEERGLQPPEQVTARQEWLGYIGASVLAECPPDAADVVRAVVSAPAPEQASPEPPFPDPSPTHEDGPGDYKVLVQRSREDGTWVTVEVHEARGCPSVADAIGRFMAAHQPASLQEPDDYDSSFLRLVATRFSAEHSTTGRQRALHLVARHADLMAAGRFDQENEGQHNHEHEGPGTIRNHSYHDLSWLPEQVEAAMREMDEQG